MFSYFILFLKICNPMELCLLQALPKTKIKSLLNNCLQLLC